MANNLNSFPWVIDTAGATVLHPGPCIVAKISWQNYTNATHEISVTTADDIPLFQTTGDADLSPLEITFPHSVQVKGLKVPTLGSGKVLIFLR